MTVLPLRMAEHPGRPGGPAAAHLVTDEQLDRAGRGHLPRAVCGRTFLPAGLVVPLGPACRACLAATRSAAPTSGTPPRSRRRVARRALLALRT